MECVLRSYIIRLSQKTSEALYLLIISPPISVSESADFGKRDELRDFSTRLKHCVCLAAASSPPLGKHCCRTGLLDLAEFWIQTQACLSERLSQHNSCSAKETWSRGNTPHPSSPQVFSNSTPLDVWEAQLVVDHKALNHCLLIKHSTQRMRTGSPSPECQQWLQMRLGSPRWSISLQADIMALCLAKGNGNFTGYRFPGFILYFLSQPRWGLSTNRIGADFWFMTIKG